MPHKINQQQIESQMDFFGYEKTKYLTYNENNRLLRYDENIVNEKGATQKKVVVIVLHYDYDAKHWDVYHPNTEGKMAVCIDFEGKYYMLYQTPRVLDRLFNFLRTRVLESTASSDKKNTIKKWSIRYPTDGESVDDWHDSKSTPIYSHNSFTNMLHWYLNNLWLFDGCGLTQVNNPTYNSSNYNTKYLKNLKNKEQENNEKENNDNIKEEKVKKINRIPNDLKNDLKNVEYLDEWVNKMYKVNVQYRIRARVVYARRVCLNPDCNAKEMGVPKPLKKGLAYLCVKCNQCTYLQDEYAALSIKYKQHYQYYNYRPENGCITFYNNNTETYTHSVKCAFIRTSAIQRNEYNYYIKRNINTKEYQKVVKMLMLTIPSLPVSYHNSCNKSQLKLLYMQSLSDDYNHQTMAFNTWKIKIGAINAEYKKSVYVAPNAGYQYIKIGQMNFNYRKLEFMHNLSYGYVNNKKQILLEKISERHWFTNTKEQLHALCFPELTVWKQMISKVNDQFKLKSKYIDTYNIHMFTCFKVNHRDLNSNYVKNDPIYNFSGTKYGNKGKSVGYTHKNYDYSCTSEQLADAYYFNHPSHDEMEVDEVYEEQKKNEESGIVDLDLDVDTTYKSSFTWIAGIHAVNREFERRFQWYEDSVDACLLQSNSDGVLIGSVNFRYLEEKSVNYTKIYTFTGHTIGTLPKLYHFSSTQEQLNKLWQTKLLIDQIDF